MGIKERKIREKEAFRALIIATAYELLAKEGLQGLTMRAIANVIEYSQSKIYEFFQNKDQLCEVLFEELCKQLFENIQEVPNDLEPRQYLSDLIRKSIEFLSTHPHADELFTLISFAPERFKIPQIYYEMEKHLISALKNLKSPWLESDEQIQVALDIIRCFRIGISSLMAFETSISGKKRVNNVAEEAIKVLLRSWDG